LAEAAFCRFKALFGPVLRARAFPRQAAELFLKAAVLNRMAHLGDAGQLSARCVTRNGQGNGLFAKIFVQQRLMREQNPIVRVRSLPTDSSKRMEASTINIDSAGCHE
jgi:hypothetical protein